MLVKNVMSPIVVTAEENESLKEAARKMRDLDIGCLLVCRGVALTGIVTDRDIACKGLADGMNIDAMYVSDVMSKDVFWCHKNETMEDVIHLMEREKIRRLPVINDERVLVGIITLGDISAHLPHELSGEVFQAISHSHTQYQTNFQIEYPERYQAYGS